MVKIELGDSRRNLAQNRNQNCLLLSKYSQREEGPNCPEDTLQDQKRI